MAAATRPGAEVAFGAGGRLGGALPLLLGLCRASSACPASAGLRRTTRRVLTGAHPYGQDPPRFTLGHFKMQQGLLEPAECAAGTVGRASVTYRCLLPPMLPSHRQRIVQVQVRARASGYAASRAQVRDAARRRRQGRPGAASLGQVAQNGRAVRRIEKLA